VVGYDGRLRWRAAKVGCGSGGGWVAAGRVAVSGCGGWARWAVVAGSGSERYWAGGGCGG
jgi:hypothetical protein